MPSDPGKNLTPAGTSSGMPSRPFSSKARLAAIVTFLPLLFFAISYLLWSIMDVSGLGLGAVLCALLAPILSVIAIIHTLRTKARGLALSIVCFVVSLHYIASVIALVAYGPGLYSQMACGTCIKGIGNGIAVYQEEFGRFPDPNIWCDLLIEHADISPKTFSLDEYREGISYVALNPAVAPDSPPDTVLAFECKPGWNQHGGPELLDPNRHKGIGCIILFKDLHIEYVKGQDYIRSLRWSADSKPPK